MRTTTYFLIAGALVVVACSGDSKARTDLEDDNVSLLTGDVQVRVNADQLPNIGHLCWDENNPIGVWTTTDRIAVIVYNDWLCPGSNMEQPMTVITGNPKDTAVAP
jgi:hypothetical protein